MEARCSNLGVASQPPAVMRLPRESSSKHGPWNPAGKRTPSTESRMREWSNAETCEHSRRAPASYDSGITSAQSTTARMNAASGTFALRAFRRRDQIK